MSYSESRALVLGLASLGGSGVSALVIYVTHPVDPHDEGFLVGMAAVLWPFVIHPLAWLVCAVLCAGEVRRGLGRRPLAGLLAATVAWPLTFLGYPLSLKPWLSAERKLADPWPDVRAHGAWLLGERRSPQDLAPLVAALRDREMDVRAAAAMALARYGPRGAAALPALVETLDDSDWLVGCRAGEALASMRGLEAQTLPPLIAQLSDDADGRSWCAAQAIAGMGPAAAAAVPALISALADHDPNVRAAAATALGSVGPQASRAAGALSQAAGDENQWVRKAASEALPRVQGVR